MADAQGPLAGRVALVTGAAGGIGAAIGDRLRADGAQVLRVDVQPAIPRTGPWHAADLATREGNRSAVEAAVDRFGRLDILVPNAGMQHVAPVAEFPEDRWDALLA
jgi:3-hydroxybutyrate dehydrogenase